MRQFSEYVSMNDPLPPLLEGVSPILYHRASLFAVAQIAKSNQIRLSVDAGTGADEALRGGKSKNKFYFLSTARSKTSSYMFPVSRYEQGATTLVLDGNALMAAGYLGKAVDYWGPEFRKRGKDEMEDRLWSDNSHIKNADKYIKEIHILFSKSSMNYRDTDEALLIDIIKRFGNKTYIYDDAKNMGLQIKNRAVLGTNFDMTGMGKATIPASDERDLFVSWKKLLNGVKKSDMDEKDKRLLYKVEASIRDDTIRGLAADIHNAKSSPTYRAGLDSLLAIMKQKKLYNAKDVVLYLQQRYRLEESMLYESAKYGLDKARSLTQYMSGRRLESYTQALDAFAKALETKQIYNAEFKELYTYGLMRPLEDTYGTIRIKYIPLMRETNFVDDPQSLFSMVSVKKHHKHWSERKSKYPELFLFFDAIKELPDMVKELKQYIVMGRKPVERDPNAPAPFVRPMASAQARKFAVTFLEEIVVSFKSELYKSVLEQMNKVVDNFKFESPKNADGAVQRELRKQFVTMYRKMNGFEQLVISRVYDQMSFTLKPDYKKILEEHAKRQAEEIALTFVEKNTMKLANIFGKKADIVKHTLHYSRVRSGMVENAMSFSFKDGSSFRVQSSVEYGWSGRTHFVRYPTRFMDVVMADGTKMNFPSEEKMVKEF